MRVAEKVVQRRVALALAHLCSPEDQKTIFIDSNGNFLRLHHLPLHLAFSLMILTVVTWELIADILPYCCHVYFVLAGLELLLELLELTNLKHQRDGSVALFKLADKASSLSPVDAGPPSPISQVRLFIFLWF